MLLIALAVTAGPANASPGQLAQRPTAAIEAEVAAIERAADRARRSGRDWVVQQARHWEVSGLVIGAEVRHLAVRFAQGRVVRDEWYYFTNGLLIMARIRKSWDMDDARAPAPPESQVFYVDDGRVVRRVIRVANAVRTTTDPAGAATIALLARAGALRRILVAPEPIRDELERLEEWPAELTPD